MFGSAVDVCPYCGEGILPDLLICRSAGFDQAPQGVCELHGALGVPACECDPELSRDSGRFDGMASDPLVSLASSIHAGPNTYALLLGSGISVSSGVPTGWEVTLELVKRLATLRGEDAGDDPLSWYRNQTEGDPDYSDLLTELAPSPGDRRNLLERFFQPTEEEREQGLKLPTNAHHAIARLVVDGFVKVIVTTNFDRLLEQALSEAGVEPSVISSSAHAAGATPIAHSRCTIVKVHGDYLSADLKNTVDELAGYDTEINRLLDEVFDQYGLVVCGWSAVWDKALREAILRSPGRRFATFWLRRGPLEPDAQVIVGHRQAIEISIQEADNAFESLADKVESLSEAVDQRPLDTALAVAQLKKYLPDPVNRIKLHDLVIGATDDVIDRVQEFPVSGPLEPQLYREQLEAYEEATAGLLRLIATGTFFSDRLDHDDLFARCLDRLANRRVAEIGIGPLLKMQDYPSLLGLYAIALGSAAADRLDSIARVLGSTTVTRDGQPLPAYVVAQWALDHYWAEQSAARPGGSKTPISNHLFSVLRTAVSEIIREDRRFEDLFDEVEYLMGCAYTSYFGSTGPVGRAAWRRYQTRRFPGSMLDRHSVVLIKAGIFESAEQLAEVRDSYDAAIKSHW